MTSARSSKSLGELFRVGSSRRVLQSQWQSEGVPFYRGREITLLAAEGFVNNALFISEDLYTDLAAKNGAPSAGDIMVTAIGTIGNSYIVKDGDRFYFKDASVLWLKKTTDVSSEFINWWLKSPLFFDQLDRGNGATVDTLTIQKLQAVAVDLPPLPEQQRLVTLLDEAFNGIATARAHAEKNLQNARAIFESHLQSVFAYSGKNWVAKNLGDTSILKIVDGDRGSNYPSKEDFSDEGYCLFLNTKNVRPDGFNFDNIMFISEEKDKALRKGKLQRSDVVLTTRGTIGNVAIYDEDVEFENIRINSGMLIFRPNVQTLLPSFLFEVFRSGIMRSQMTRHVSGAAQPQLPIKTLIDFEIPVPNTLSAQREIVASVREIEAETQRLESIYQRKLTALDELKKSLLAQAFSGAL